MTLYRAVPEGWYTVGTVIFFTSGITIILFLWLMIGRFASEVFSNSFNLFFPWILFLVILAALIDNIYVKRRLYYIDLEKQEVTINRGSFPRRIPYMLIHGLSFRGNKLVSIDLKEPLKWPNYVKIKSQESFINDMKKRYKKATGQELKINHDWD